MWKLLTIPKRRSLLEQARKLLRDNPEEAMRACEEAIRINPADAEAHEWMGMALRSLNQLDKAAEAYEEALRLEPDRPFALCGLGLVRVQQGDMMGALLHYRRAAELDPTDALLCNIYVSILSQQGQLDEALSAAQRAVEALPHQMMPLLTLGKVYQKRGDHSAAIQTYRAATRATLQFRPAVGSWLGRWIQRRVIDLPFRRMRTHMQLSLRGQAHEKLGDLFAETGQPEDARREWQSALGLWKDAQAREPANAAMREKSVERVRKKLEELDQVVEALPVTPGDE